jgi:hypothetical protein
MLIDISMSHFTDIGFPVSNQEEYDQLIRDLGPLASPNQSEFGTYFCFADPSGAEVWFHVDSNGELQSVQPHFRGNSRRTLNVIGTIMPEGNSLLGALHGWADPDDPENPESGKYPFAFELPDFRLTAPDPEMLPAIHDIQLSGFAEPGFRIYPTEEAFLAGQEGETHFAAESFIPIGLFSDESEDESPSPAYGMFAGRIREWKKIRNTHSGVDFYCFAVQTLGGEIDVVAAPELVTELPVEGGIISGTFWLSGILLPRAG